MNKNLFSNPKTTWSLLIFGYLIAAVNGIRPPNLWSVNYFIPSIFDGFYRRSLGGTLLYFLGDLRFNYYVIASIQIAVFIALNMIIIRAWRNSSEAFKWILPLFLISPAGGYFFHEIGYIDQLLYLLLFIAIGCSSVVFGSLIILSSLWFHELTLFTTVPLYLAYLVLNKKSWKSVFIVSSIFTFCFTTIYIFFQTTSQQNLSIFLSYAQQHANYPIRIDYYDVFSNRFIGGRFQWYYSSREVLDFLLMIPLWILSGYAFSKDAISIHNKKIYFLVGFLAAFSPMILGIFGWDCHRWIFLSLCSTTLCFYWLRSHIQGNLAWLIAFFYILFVFFGFLDYFDTYIPRLGNWDHLHYFINGGFWDVLLRIPTR